MKKISILIFVIIGLISCQDDESADDFADDVQVPSLDFNFTYLVTYKNDVHDPIIKQEYAIEDGKVLAEKYTNYNNPEYSHLSLFEYDETGRILREIQENKVVKQVVWDDKNAKVYNINNDLIGQFFFNDTMRLESYIENIQRFLNYDSHGNIISIASEEGIYVEYLDYDSSKVNPLSLIKSIEILRINYKPHFKNVFKTEKVYPYEGDDYSVPMSYYEYIWTLNSNGLIETITNEKTAIYLDKFEYK